MPAGQLFCLLGPNGAGKTTTVSVLTTTLAPTSGQIRIAGRDLVTEQGRARRELGIVFQQPSLDRNLTAEENIRLHAVLYGLYPWRPIYRLMPAAYRRQVQAAAGVLDLADILGQRARALSGGLRRRLEIVRALMHRPRVLFLDEPTAGLDPGSRRSLWAHLGQAQGRLRDHGVPDHPLPGRGGGRGHSMRTRRWSDHRARHPAEVKARRGARRWKTLTCGCSTGSVQ